MSTEGFLWFCNDCTKALKKLVRLNTTTEMEFKEHRNNSLKEIKSTQSDLKAKSTHSTIPLKPKPPNVHNESSSKIYIYIPIWRLKYWVYQNFFPNQIQIFGYYVA